MTDLSDIGTTCEMAAATWVYHPGGFHDELATLLMRAAARIRELEAEIARRNLFDGCDGCSTGDCPHNLLSQCVQSQAQVIREQAATIALLDTTKGIIP